MALFLLACKKCKTVVKRFLDTPPRKLRCLVCGGPVNRAPKAPSTQMMEKLDNGAMSTALERLANAEEMHLEHAYADPVQQRDRETIKVDPNAT